MHHNAHSKQTNDHHDVSVLQSLSHPKVPASQKPAKLKYFSFTETFELPLVQAARQHEAYRASHEQNNKAFQKVL